MHPPSQDGGPAGHTSMALAVQTGPISQPQPRSASEVLKRQLMDSISLARQTESSLRNQATTQQDSIDDLATKLEEARGRAAASAAKVSSLETYLEESRHNYATLRKQIETSKSLVTSVMEQVRTYEKVKALGDREREVIKATDAARLADLDAVRRAILDAQLDKATAEASAANDQRALQVAKADLEACHAAKLGLESALAGAEEKAAELAAAVAALTEAAQRSSETLEAITADRDHVAASLAAQTTKVEELEAAIAQTTAAAQQQ